MHLPHFEIKLKFQKRSDTYKDILTADILRKVCQELTGKSKYTVDFIEEGYNIGRLAKLSYDNRIHYVSFSDCEIQSRNSFFQSFPSALVKFHQETSTKKTINFYFLNPDGNINTNYFKFMYRLMKTVGVNFLNDEKIIGSIVRPFNSVSDIVSMRNSNREQNSSNASTYVTTGEESQTQIFGKTYGANKYETVLLSLAIREVEGGGIELYEIKEGNLTALPAESRELLIQKGVKVISSDLELEKTEFDKNDSLRSPKYIYNLLAMLGPKKCFFCECELPQIIHGAHIWPVASIKKDNLIKIDDKISYATQGSNGLWLCENHHKLFDSNILFLDLSGNVKYKNILSKHNISFLKKITTSKRIESIILNKEFKFYLKMRNKNLNTKDFVNLAS
jgi:hypothetical protein